MNAPISKEEKEYLLELAYRAVNAAASGSELPTTGNVEKFPRLNEAGASFVTITLDNQLRGCIGAIESRLPLAQDVVIHAYDAATRDPRFPPIQPIEVERVSIEISVLTNPEPLEYQQGDDIPSLIRPGIDGVILRQGRRQATFLPQVWEKVSGPEDFLNRLCEKANMLADAWKTEPVEILTYQVESFHRSGVLPT